MWAYTAYANGENANSNDYNQDSYHLLANNRNTTILLQNWYSWNVIGSVIAPY